MTTETNNEMYADKLEAKVSTLKALLREASEKLKRYHATLYKIGAAEIGHPLSIEAAGAIDGAVDEQLEQLLSRIEESLK